MKLYAANVDKISHVTDVDFSAFVDSKRREGLNLAKREGERKKSLCAGLLLRRAFLDNGYNDNMWHNIEIAEGSYGKPYAANYNNFCYSISHSGEWVICAVDDIDIGADIQEMKTPKMAVAKRFYSEGEYKSLLGYEADKDRQTAEFYRMWTAKESCVKLTGRGIGAGIKRYSADSSYTYITDAEGDGRFFIKLYESIPHYMVCVCSRRADFADSIIVTDAVNDIFNMEER